MKIAPSGTPHDTSPETALAALQTHPGPILIDLDETLYLRNSTEDFIDTARPRLPALLLLRALDLIKPWRWTGGELTRDIWRVRLILLCFPWTSRLWRQRVPILATSFANRPLLAVLHRPGQPAEQRPIIATVGFEPIVRPLVAALGLAQSPIVAARLSGCADRLAGKLALSVAALGIDTVRHALVLTDSDQDRALLDACARPLRVLWPQAHYQPAFSTVYLPGQYLTQVKRPGERYIVRGILQEDFAFWVLSSIALASVPWLHVLGLLGLLVSFWTLYERGYVDNDLIAARFELDPKLSDAFAEAPVVTPTWSPWFWAAACGTLGVLLLRWPGHASAGDLAAWAAVLLASHGWFLLYNRYDKATRVWLFAGLQFARSTAFVALVPISPIGAAALGAHVLAKWVPYYVYRLGGQAWPQVPFHLTRLLFFVALALLQAFSLGASTLLNGTALALLAWNLFRAREELVAASTAAERIDRPQPAESTPKPTEPAP